jgi:hypothetical protein
MAYEELIVASPQWAVVERLDVVFRVPLMYKLSLAWARGPREINEV